MVVFPCMGDQISNSVRLEETGYGHLMSLVNVNEKELKTKIDDLINNQELRSEWKKASKRIQKDYRIGKVVDHIANTVLNLKN